MRTRTSDDHIMTTLVSRMHLSFRSDICGSMSQLEFACMSGKHLSGTTLPWQICQRIESVYVRQGYLSGVAIRSLSMNSNNLRRVLSMNLDFLRMVKTKTSKANDPNDEVRRSTSANQISERMLQSDIS